jgi:hypothetical protein
MISTPIELIAFILIAISLIKITVIAVDPMIWYRNVVKVIFGNQRVTQVISLILAATVLYYLLAELTIVQILAAVFFMVLIMVFGLVSFGVKLLSVYEELYQRKNILKRYWFYTVIWLVLLLWGLKELFS